MKLKINNDCCVCSFCYRACAVDAPYYDGEQVQIDQSKCVGCGKCLKACPMGAIYDEDNPPQAPVLHETTRLDCDALILGAGGAGMVAAVRIAEATGKKVIVLEKAKRTGSGALHVAGGLRLFDTQWEKDAGAEEMCEEYVKVALNTSHYEFDKQLVENSFRALPRFFDWFCTWTNAHEKFELVKGRNGRLTVDSKSLRPDSPWFHNAGEYIMTQLFKRAKELGVEVLHETPAKEFILDNGGQVVGVKAQDPGGEVEVTCRACLVATGSLLLGDVIKRVLPDYADAYMPRFAHAINVYTGDGVTMCEKAGIPIDYDNICVAFTGNLVMPCDAMTVEYGQATGKRPLMPTDLRPHANRPEALMVNQNGERWINEQYCGTIFYRLLKQPQCVSYTIMDEATIKSKPMKKKPLYVDSGLGRATPMAVPGPGEEPNPANVLGGMPFEEKAEWNDDTMQWIANLKNKHLVIADTLEELAEKTEIPYKTLKQTIDHYNSLCAKVHDDDFLKDPDYLVPIRKGPYYAIRTFLMSDGAQGGLFIDANMQVKGKDGLMKGLYAAGDTTSGRLVNKGGQKIQTINDYTWAVGSGMVAAASIIAQLTTAAV